MDSAKWQRVCGAAHVENKIHEAPLDRLGRCGAREIRHNRLRDFFLEYIKSTGAVEARALHTAGVHTSEPNGTDIWLDVRVGMAKPDCSLP